MNNLYQSKKEYKNYNINILLVVKFLFVKNMLNININNKNMINNMNAVNEFKKLHDMYIRNPHLKKEMGQDICKTGMEAVSQTTNLSIKEDILTKLIAIYPEEPGLYYYMGYAFKDIDATKALPWFQKSYTINPNNLENAIDLCNILFHKDRSLEIIKMNDNNSFDQFLDDSRFLTIYVQAKCKEHYYKDCIKHLNTLISRRANEKAITKDDKTWKYSNYLNIGYMYSISGNYNKAIQYSEKAYEMSVKFKLDMPSILTAFTNALCFADFTYSNNEETFKQHLKINKHLPDKQSFLFTNRKPKSKIRIGYVSSDFMNHAVANFILPILKNHDKSKFEVHLFANQKNEFIMFTDLRLPYHNIHKLDDIEAATLINKQEIDILIDLNGYTVNSRLGIFSLNPAPIQMTYLGYPNTTGLTSIKYRLTDIIADNLETNQQYTEELIRLPKCFLLYKSIYQKTQLTPRITADTIILGALNKENKNSKFAMDVWKVILKECPNTKLLIKLEAYDDNISRLDYYMKHLEVDKNRLIVMNKVNDQQYNKLFTMVDIMLDTFPYSGTTTTCNALYNSTPVVTLYNKDYHAHNVSSSLLTNSGLPELVAKTNEEYIKIVKDLVNNKSKINEYKETIHTKFMKLMEPKAFMRDYERAIITKYSEFYNIKIDFDNLKNSMDSEDDDYMIHDVDDDDDIIHDIDDDDVIDSDDDVDYIKKYISHSVKDSYTSNNNISSSIDISI